MKKKYFYRVFSDSIKILIITSLISSFGGASLESVRERIFVVMPLLIMLPAMNSMAGNFGSIVSSKFTTMLFLGVVSKRNWRKSNRIKNLFVKMFVIALILAFYVSVVSCAVSVLQGYKLSVSEFFKILLLAYSSVIILLFIIFFVAIFLGFLVFKRGHNPDNFLIPITTAIGDFGNMLLISILTTILF
ncbi:MAG: hypothetical protein GON13_03295 [Nanoarchaeota archaeon]|nr:hypothetical protein [Nanoarchaeota archaeon]